MESHRRGGERPAKRIIAEWSDRGQGHLFTHWQARPEAQRARLLSDLEQLEAALLTRLQRRLAEPPQRRPELQPLEGAALQRARCGAEAEQLGEQLLRSGRAAFLTVAGGQGSRLGFEGPKGCFPVSPMRGASLFQLLSEKILAAVRRYERPLQWLIMTSPLNDAQTRGYFEENRFFGLDPMQVAFFPQGLFPSLSEEGKLLLAPDGGLFRNPNGHGGVIQALHEAGLLERLSERGVEELFYCQVDNPLVRIPDPLFLGAHRLQGSQMATKVIPKAYPEEKLGVIALADGKPAVIEYSDLDDEQMQARDSEGRLLYSHGSIAIHLLNVPFLAGIQGRLPLHVARKQIASLRPTQEGGRVARRLAVKFEMFIFDAIPMARTPLFFETTREEEFSPLKNRTGVDSIETCRQGMIAQYARWLEQCGVTVPNRRGRALYRVEISPLFATDAETLKLRLGGSVNRIDGDTLLA
jgi:UDP-N-acetylglucosamine/UDP-N-acetylgalactosamine diphosphorylase